MIRQFLLFFCLLLHGYRGLVNATTTSFTFYTDGSCQNSAINMQTSTQAGNGDCGTINEFQSVNLIESAPNCSLTIYTDDACSDNATAVSFGSCITMTTKSYSVDCPQQNGVLDGYTTISAVSSHPSRSPPSSSISASSTTQPQQGLTSPTHSSGLGSITNSSSDRRSTSRSVTPRSSSSTTSLSLQTPKSSSTNQHLSSSAAASATPAPSTSKTQKDSGNDGGWSRKATIIIAVVLSIFFGSLIAAIHFFVVGRPKPPKPWELSSGDTNGSDSGRGVMSESAVRSRDNNDLAPSAPQVHPVELDS